MGRRHGCGGRPVRMVVAALGLLILGHQAIAAEPHHRAAHRGLHRGPAPHRAGGHRAAPPKKTPPPSPAPSQPSAAPEAVETLEDVEVAPIAAAPIDAATAQSQPSAEPVQNFLLRTCGRLHAASVHLPIAWTVLWALAEAVGPALGVAPLTTAALPLGVLTCLSFLPSMASGWLRLGELSLQPGYDLHDGVFHRNTMWVAGAVLLGCLLLRILWAFFPARWLRRLYVASLLVALAIVAFGAHLGGRLVYGDDFLPFG